MQNNLEFIFRFPVAHYPTCQASQSDLYKIFWDAVKMLSLYGFLITFISVDGAQANRVLMKMLIPDASSPKIDTMLFPNIFDRTLPKISFIMDYSHVMKKIRNNILKSGTSDNHKRLLTVKGEHIVWDHWVKAFEWDIANNSLKVHHKLTQDHFMLTTPMKMRNKLAEDVLDCNMLHLMELYKNYLGEKGTDLDRSIDLLKQTSILVSVFRDHRHISAPDDPRLSDIKAVGNWFNTWEEEILSSELSNKDKH